MSIFRPYSGQIARWERFMGDRDDDDDLCLVGRCRSSQDPKIDFIGGLRV